MKKQKYNEPPYRFEYRLTEMGLDFFPVILTMIDWGDKWLAGSEGPPLLLYHKVCNYIIKPITVCSSCGKEVKIKDISYKEQTTSGTDYDNASVAMRKFDQSSYRACSVERFLNLFGDRLTFLVIRAAFFGVRRFDQFLNEIDIPRSSLISRLRALVDNGIFKKKLYCQHPQRFEYGLTQKGKDLYPFILATLRWGDSWLAGKDEPPLLLFHGTCGQIMKPKMICANCKSEISIRDTRYENGPGASVNVTQGK